MRDLDTSVHLKLTHTCLIVTVTLSNPQSDPRKGAELLSFLCVLACCLGGLHVSHAGTRDQVWWGSISTNSEIRET